jgi:taurine dioxygenase
MARPCDTRLRRVCRHVAGGATARVLPGASAFSGATRTAAVQPRSASSTSSPPPSSSPLTVTRLAGALGAEVHGVDAGSLGSQMVADQLQVALHEHLVLVLRNQSLAPAQFEDFCTRCFGPLFVHPVFPGISPEHPAVIAVSNRGKKYDTNSHWHSDATFVERPPMATGAFRVCFTRLWLPRFTPCPLSHSMATDCLWLGPAALYALEVPEFGGDTLFANQYLAYDRLSSTMQGVLNPLRAVHSGASTTRLVNKDSAEAPQAVQHPIVRVHPATGKRALFVTQAFVRGIDGCVPLAGLTPFRKRRTIIPTLSNWFARTHLSQDDQRRGYDAVGAPVRQITR